MKFRYQARTEEGELRSGVVEASSREDAVAIVREYGFYVTSLEEMKPSLLTRISIFNRVSLKDLSLFSRQLAVMFNSRVPLVEALETLSYQARNPYFKEKILEISRSVRGGTAFSDALSRCPKIFSPFYIGMVKAGEASGKLSESLSKLADYTKSQYELHSKLLGAMLYPAFVVLVFLAIGSLAIFFVMPKMTTLLAQFNVKLPLMTRIVMKLGDFLRTKGWVVIIGIVVFGIAVFEYIRSKSGKELWDKLSLKMPVLGNFLKKVALVRFAENFSTLIFGGLSVSRALEITGNVVGNTVYKNVILEARDAVKRGEPVHAVFLSYPELFPSTFIQMIIVGERTGHLQNTLLNVVDFYKTEVTRGIDTFIKLLEPLLVIILGIGVVIFAVTVLLPLYQMRGIGFHNFIVSWS